MHPDLFMLEACKNKTKLELLLALKGEHNDNVYVAGFWARDRDKSELRFNGLFNKSEDSAPHIHKA